MAVAFDVETESHTGTTGSVSQASFTWNHTGGGSARAALVFVFSIGALTDTSVTYGGAAMTAVPYTAADTDTELGAVRAYFLDNVATGTQAVVVNRTNNAVQMYAVCFTVTAASATSIVNGLVQTKSASTATATGASSTGTGTGTLALLAVDDGSPGTNSLRFMGRYQGTSSVTAAGSGSTAGPSIDFGLFVIDTFRETTAGQGARNVGGATITDDVAAIALAIRETPAALNPQPTALSLTTAWSTPAVFASDSKVALPTALALVSTWSTPAVAVTNNVLALPTALALTWTGAVPSVKTPVVVSPAALALVLTGAVPAIALPVVSLPTPLTLVLTGAVPAVLTPVQVSPAALALILSGAVPAVSLPIVTLPDPFTLVWAGVVPAVVVSEGGEVGPIYTDSDETEILLIIAAIC